MTFQGGSATYDTYGGGAILAGGVANALSLTNCVFSGNNVPSSCACSGGALAYEGGGVLTINQCTFSNNTNPNGGGGAFYYSLQNSFSGSLAITNTIFSGNTCTAANSQGGAILLSLPGASPDSTSAISITQNNFTGNSVSGAGSLGGAISIDNAYLPGNTAYINFNRFYKNTATYIPDVVVGDAQGNVDLTNNWWGRNVSPVGTTDPHALQEGTSGGGVMVTSPWLELTCSELTSTLCGGSGGTTPVTVGFTKNSAGTTIAASNLAAVVGQPVTFTATLGTLSAASGTIGSSGTVTVDVTPLALSGTVDVHAVVDSVTATDAIALAAFGLTAPASLPSASSSGSIVIGGTEPATDASCNEIVSLVASGASPLAGSVTAGVTLDGSVQSYQGVPYVTRHYDITPASNASSATATVTLYFLQSEFNAYNAVVNDAAMSLPTSSTDAAGAARLTITQYHGSGTLPGNYSGWTGPGPASVLISPGSSNVVWNSAKNWWEVSFPVTGFSGFYVAGPVGLPLPVTLERFTGVLQGTGVMLNWQVADETGLLRYEVQGSADGVGFGLVGVVGATGAAGSSGSGGSAGSSGSAGSGGSSGAGGSGGSGAAGSAGGSGVAGGSGSTAGWAGTYQYFVANPLPGENYYRLKMVNADGSFSYSPVVVVDVTLAGHGVVVLSNPFTTSCTLRVTAVSGGPVNLRLMDMSGKVLWVSSMTLVAGVNTFALPGAEGLAAGVYLVSLVGGEMRETVKVVKE